MRQVGAGMCSSAANSHHDPPVFPKTMIFITHLMKSPFIARAAKQRNVGGHLRYPDHGAFTTSEDSTKGAY
jgi:hypothetical protein